MSRTSPDDQPNDDKPNDDRPVDSRQSADDHARHVPATRPPITQSPWFWVYMFCTAGLIGLMLFGDKLNQRQVSVERNFQGRQRVLEERAGDAPQTGLSSPGDTALTLRPLYLLLGAGFVVSWIILWWQRFRSPSIRQRDLAVRDLPADGGAPPTPDAEMTPPGDGEGAGKGKSGGD